MLSKTEENYLKAILKLTVEEDAKMAGTNDIAGSLAVKPATVNSMLKKLRAKSLLDFRQLANLSSLDMIWILSVRALPESPWRVVAQISGAIRKFSLFEIGVPRFVSGRGGLHLSMHTELLLGWVFDVSG